MATNREGPVAAQADGNDAHGVDQGDDRHIVLVKINKLFFKINSDPGLYAHPNLGAPHTPHPHTNRHRTPIPRTQIDHALALALTDHAPRIRTPHSAPFVRYFAPERPVFPMTKMKCQI